MTFSFVRFNQAGNTRMYAFDGVEDKGRPTRFTVEVNMDLVRTYSISLQELPLVCRRLLDTVSQAQTLTLAETLTEERMRTLHRAAQDVVRARESKYARPFASGGTSRA
jgi:hypothetical protein